MRSVIERTIPSNDLLRKWFAAVLTALFAALLTLWGIYAVRGYGIALFILTPLFIGAGSTIIYGLKNGVTRLKALEVGLISLGIYLAGLLIFAIEGLICVAMAAPIGLVLTWLGCLLGVAITNKKQNIAPTALMVLIGIIPTMAFIERDSEPTLTAVVTSIDISADPRTVWKNVVEFPKLDAPTEFIFTTGIAYPTSAYIEGTGVGAVRHCEFTTGSFREPITVWNEPYLLKFDVEEQPAPMRELSFWNVDAPHLHDYFVSRQGQFRLIALPNGTTRLEGTTWYYHAIRPAFYWQLWSDWIVHSIHERVLTHIKANAEQAR